MPTASSTLPIHIRPGNLQTSPAIEAWVHRADAAKVIRAARDADKRCFYTADDIRVADTFG
ncbi:MAG: hypothetical protein IT435_15540 [Phycisphaerales bacterium]|nr:hypothetical protein [Phycisphaerales bacterium]